MNRQLPASMCARLHGCPSGRTVAFAGGEPRPITKFHNGFTTCGWDVRNNGGEWVLERESQPTMCICPGDWPQGLAIDAAMEYMDRCREENVPRWCVSPEDLMRFCAGEARKQR